MITASAGSFFPSIYPDQDANTPTNSKTNTAPSRGRTRPRTLQLGEEDKKNTPTESSQRKTQRTSLGGNRKATPTVPAVSRIGDSKTKNSRMSTPNLHKLESVQESRRASAGTNLSKSKSTSMHSLGTPNETKTTNRPRSKWTTSKMASFASVPNLLVSDDEDDFTSSPLNLSKSSELSRSVGDVNDEKENKPVKQSPVKQTDASSASYKRRSVQLADKRSASTSRLSGGTAKALVEERKPMTRRVGASVSSLRNVKGSGNDRDLMPPPAVTEVAKTKPETKFVKRAQQARRKTTSDISLEEAKDILKGNSGILKSGDSKPKSRNSSISSASPTNVAPEVRPNSVNDKDHIDIISDPKFLNVASEIEQTAAEIRRHSGPNLQYSDYSSSRYDPPEHDIPPERDIPNLNIGQRNQDSAKYSVNNAKTSTHVNVEIEPVSKVGKSFPDSEVNIGAGIPSQDDEDYPSPSVKERIARLNKTVSEVDRANSPYGERLHSQSPVLDNRRAVSPRITSSTQISFSQPRSEVTSSQSSSFTSSSVSIVSVASSLGTVTSGSAPSRLSNNTSKSSQPLQPIPFDPGNEIGGKTEADYLKPVTVSAISANVKGTNNYFVEDSMKSSQDSEGLAHHLSPGSFHSNHSPQSGVDTGLGSDTDTDLSNSMTSSIMRDRLGYNKSGEYLCYFSLPI